MKEDPLIPVRQYFNRYVMNGMVSFQRRGPAKGRAG